MMNRAVTFSHDDVELLYAVPQPGGDLVTIVRTFTFLNRSSAPQFTILRDCFTKALQAGILLARDGRYQVIPEWYERIHKHDDSEANEIQSMLAFGDEFVGEEVPITCSSRLAITEEDYKTLVKDMC